MSGGCRCCTTCDSRWSANKKNVSLALQWFARWPFSMCVTVDLNMDTNQMWSLNAWQADDRRDFLFVYLLVCYQKKCHFEDKNAPMRRCCKYKTTDMEMHECLLVAEFTPMWLRSLPGWRTYCSISIVFNTSMTVWFQVLKQILLATKTDDLRSLGCWASQSQHLSCFVFATAVTLQPWLSHRASATDWKHFYAPVKASPLSAGQPVE